MENNDDTKHELLPGGAQRSIRAASAPRDCEPLLHPWKQLAMHLSPLIGESGFCALYGRAMRLVVPRFEWLKAAQPGKNTEQSLGTLTGIYATVHVDAATAANTALLNTFTELLSALIGQALTNRLLDSAWNGRHEQKNEQEHK
jgi:hypothetical protein